MKTFTEYFTVILIIRELCLMRMKLAEFRHKKCFYHHVSRDKPTGEKARHGMADELEGLFPSRRKWPKFHPGSKNRRHMNSHDVNAETLWRAVCNLMNEKPELPWVMKLLERASAIQLRALDNHNFGFSPPMVIGDLKNPATHEYRPISMYGTDDSIIQKITARYLSEKLDFCFSSSSLAYRGKQKKPEPPINRDTAPRQITDFRRRHPRIFVAEADLRNFMDCVDHRVVRESLHALIRQGKKLKPDLEIDPIAIQIHDAFLASYNFKREVLGRGLETLMKRDPNAIFPWPEESLRKMREHENLDEIGIPQGGAISCFITNVMLHDADESIMNLKKHEGHEIDYLRYCDDMLILSTDRDACQEAMAAYQSAIERKMLLMHEPVDVFQQGGKPKPDYWNLKSKMPYLWSRPDDNGIPWIQFLGFEIRHDGLVRIRKKSLEKQCGKITDEADKLIRVINPGRKIQDGIPVYAPGLRMNPHVILHCFKMKLIAMSVGRRKSGQPLPSCRDDIMPMCWANGYKALWDVPYDPSQLKQLDRHRERQVRRINNVLKPLMEQHDSNQSNNSNKKRRYHGAPYSYHGQFARKAEELDENYGSQRVSHHQPEGAAPNAGGLLKRLMDSIMYVFDTILRGLWRHR